ncbi:MAG: IS1182 family transposase [Ktedonobacteraceae bacterium]
MSMHAQPLEPIPELTSKIARASFPKGTLAMLLRDALDGVWNDEAFRALYPKRGRGALAPWRLAMVVVLQAVENLSDAQAAEMVRGRLDWKYALSFPLDDTGFDASILTDFRQRLVEHEAQELLLEPILRLCVERGWIVPKGKQRVDSTMVLSQARRLSSLESVGETLRVALNALAEEEPDWVLSVVSEDWFDRYVHRFELQRFPKGKAAQEALVQAVGEDGWTVLEAVKQPGAPKGLAELEEVHLLKRVWEQHYERTLGKINWRDGPAVKNAERVVTPHDEDARESRKRATEWLGYKVHLMETCNPEEKVHLITHVETTEATVQDVERTEALLDAAREKGWEVEEALLDSGYVSGAILVKQRHKGCEIIGPVLGDVSQQQKQGYGTQAFALDWEQKQAICPQGQASRQWTAKRDKRGEEVVQIFFAPKECQVCPVKALCTTSRVGGRTLTVSPREIHEALQERRGQQREPAFQQEYARRSGIEGSLSEGVRAHGMRRSRYQGRDKTHLQMVSVAAAINLCRISHFFEREQAGLPPRRVRRPSAFARLREQKVA